MQLHIPQNEDDTNYAECKEWISINTLVKIEQHLQTHNQKHIREAHGSFPTIPPSPNGWIGLHLPMLQSSYLKAHSMHKTPTKLKQALIQHMKKHTTLNTILDTITITEWMKQLRTGQKIHPHLPQASTSRTAKHSSCLTTLTKMTQNMHW